MFRKKSNKVTFNLNNIQDKAILDNVKKDFDKRVCEKFIKYKPKTGSEPIITVKNLGKSFGHHKVLEDFNLTFYKKENVAILGGNGAGKTTLVETMAGLNKYDKGSIEYNMKYKTTFQERIGIQFQDSKYPKGLTTKDVLYFILDIFKSKLNEDEIKALVNIFGVNEFYDKKASSLSGGQSQRLNCLLSMVHEPEFLILDELSTGLDVTIKNRIKTFMKEYAEVHGTSILLISHDVEEIEYMCERIVILKEGVVFVDALLEDVNKKFGNLAKCLDYYIQ